MAKPLSASTAALFDRRDWHAAQAALAPDLARLALLLGAVDERLRRVGPTLAARLALMEATDLSWWTGDRLPVDRLALWMGLHVATAEDDGPALVRAAWAARRLAQGAGPAEGGWQSGPARFLGRQGPAVDRGRFDDLAATLEACAGLHPVTEACLVFHAWRLLVPGPTGETEAAVMAARHAASAARGGAPFLPLALGGPDALRASGPAAARLAGWYAGGALALQAALMHLDRLEAWAGRAAAALADRSGRTPAELTACFLRWPHVSASLAATETGASRAAVQRNLELMAGRGLIREVTGRTRFRVWAARA